MNIEELRESENGPNLHFRRSDDRYIGYNPDDKLFEVLPYLDDEELTGLGLQPWDDDRNIWLFPVEWYEHIPEGLEIVTINREVKKFDRDEDKIEGRYGALPFGIARPDYEEPGKKDKSVVRVNE